MFSYYVPQHARKNEDSKKQCKSGFQIVSSFKQSDKNLIGIWISIVGNKQTAKRLDITTNLFS
jgi:hypothetical protein